MSTRTNNKPTHKLYAVTKSASTDKGFWQEIAFGCFGTGRHISSANSYLNQSTLVAFVLSRTVLAQVARGLASQVLQPRPALPLTPFAIIAIRPLKDCAQGARAFTVLSQNRFLI
jgi:hypothetical protein